MIFDEDTVGIRAEIPRDLHNRMVYAKIKQRRSIQDLIVDALAAAFPETSPADRENRVVRLDRHQGR